jgi:flagellar biosynthetic protein FliP
LNPALALGDSPLAPQLKILALLTLLSLLPAIVLTMTSFTRTVIVLSFVRQGVGTPQSPPNQVLVGIAIFITIFTMTPVVDRVMTDAYEPYVAGKIKGAHPQLHVAPNARARPGAVL